MNALPTLSPARGVLISLSLVIALAASFNARLAAGAAGLAVSVTPVDSHGKLLSGPGYFVVRRAAGHTAHLYARLTDRGSGKAAIRLLPVDAGRDAGGNIIYALPDAPRRQVGGWVHLERTTVHLKAGKSAVITFSVAVPRSVKAGQYLGALTAFVPVGASSAGAGGVLRLQPRLAVAILVTVPPGGHA